MFTLTVISVSFFGPLTLINYFADFQSSSYTFVEFPTSVLLGVWYAGLIIIIFDIRDRQAKLQTEIAIQEMQFELARQSQLGISSKFSQQIKNVIQEKLKEGS